MRDFKRNNYSNRGRSFEGNRSSQGGHGYRPATMYPAVCSNCGKACEVPFRPSGKQPVYCRDCYKARSDTDTRRPEEKNFSQNRPASTPDYKAQLDALTQKVDKILELLSANETPSEEPQQTVVEDAAPEKKKRTSKKSS